MDTEKAETLLVGAGPMAVEYAKVLVAAGISFRVAGRGQASADAFEQAFRIKVGTGELEDQLSNLPGVPSTAIVAVGVAELPSVARTLIGRGVDRILLEKPGAPTSAAMRILADLDRRDAIRVAYNRRFLQSALAARRIVEEDGGAQSLHFEFTEIPRRIPMHRYNEEVLAHWSLANSSHVFDLAFHLAGAEESLADVQLAGSVASGRLDWHPSGSRFVGCGRVQPATNFSYTADWTSGGGWAVEVCTAKRRLRLRPLEDLTEQMAGEFTVNKVAIPPDPVGLKPGLPGVVEAFFAAGGRGLPNARQQADRMAVFDRFVTSTLDQ